MWFIAVTTIYSTLHFNLLQGGIAHEKRSDNFSRSMEDASYLNGR